MHTTQRCLFNERVAKTSSVPINPELSIPDQELWFKASRSSGPGGQNVNKVNTRVTLFFDVENSPSLTERQKARIRRGLANRISRKGVLRVVSQRYRSQEANRREASRRLSRLLQGALSKSKPRRPTSRPARADRRRLEQKRRQSLLKRSRSRSAIDDY